jgi:signal transduction histidine kinase
LTELSQELFEYGKPAGLQLARGSIADVIRDAASARAPLAEQQGVRMALPRDLDIAPLLMDRTRLIRVFENLLENAIQHSPRGGEVVVEIQPSSEGGSDVIDCVVKDAGPGIAAEDMPHVLEPFFTRRRGGTGLGLSIVQRIVEEHGGKVVVRNRPEGGAAITVRIPLTRSQANAA